MACRLFGTKPFSEPMLLVCQLDPVLENICCDKVISLEPYDMYELVNVNAGSTQIT